MIFYEFMIFGLNKTRYIASKGYGKTHNSKYNTDLDFEPEREINRTEVITNDYKGLLISYTLLSTTIKVELAKKNLKKSEILKLIIILFITCN